MEPTASRVDPNDLPATFAPLSPPVVNLVVNPEKLQAELEAAFRVPRPFTGWNSTGTVFWTKDATDADKGVASAVFAAHDPTPTAAQKLRAAGLNPITWAQAALTSQKASKGSLVEAQRIVAEAAAKGDAALSL